MPDRKKHKRMTSAEQARLSDSLYGGASQFEPVVQTRGTSRRSTPTGNAARSAPSRADGVDAYKRRQRRKGRGRVLKVFLITVLVLLAGAGSALGLYLADINSRLNEGVSAELRQQLVAVEPQEPFYMLLLGVDKSEGRSEEWGADASNFRADTIILARVDPPGQKVTLVSIPRDTMVDMGANGEQKINAAYSFGGAAYMVDVVSSFAGVDISHYAEIDFEQLISIVDTIGGIEVTLPVAVQDDYAVIDLPAGTQTLNGEQALGLCRARHAYDEYGGGDFYRAANQRMVIGAIVKKVLQLGDLTTMAATVSELANSVTTDFSVTDIVGLVGQFRSFDVDNNMYSGQVPTISEYINNLWYEIVDEDAWNEMMDRVRAGESPYSDASQDFTAGVAGSIGSGTNISDGDGTSSGSDSSDTPSVEPSYSGDVIVLNGTGIAGLAGSTATDLAVAGFDAVSGNASEGGVTTTAIYYNGSSESAAVGVAETLGVSTSQVHENDGTHSTEYDVVVILGSDLG